MFLDDLMIVWVTLVLSSSFIDEEAEAQKSDSLKITHGTRSGVCLTHCLFCYLAAERVQGGDHSSSGHESLRESDEGFGFSLQETSSVHLHTV